MFVFTRFLYCYDEVKANLLIELLFKKNFYKVIFWATEIFCSGFKEELWQQIWRMYYEFYALNNSVSFTKIKNSQKKYNKIENKKGGFIYILKILNEMFYAEPTCDLFIIHNMYSTPTIKIKFELLFEKIKKNYEQKNIKALARNLYICSKKHPEKLIKCAEKVKKRKVQINEYYDNNYLKMLAFLLRKPIKQKKKPILSSQYSIFMHKLISFKIEKRPDKILKKWRKYPISDYTYAFKLKRKKVDIKQCFWYHWEYYASFSPFWGEKIKEYDGKINKEKKTIEFPNDDLYEDFYEMYNYDIDELDLKTQEKSTRQLLDLVTSDLLVDVFDGKKLLLPLNKKIENIKIKY